MAELTRRNWLKLDATRTFLYYFGSVTTLGVLPLICFYYPHVFYQISTVSCSPEESRFVHVALGEEELICEIEHYAQYHTGERLFSIEVECVRYCASNRNKYTFCRVPDVPIHFKRFLLPNYESIHKQEDLEEESRLMKIHYGKNVMKIPETSFFEIALRYMLSPFYLFQYFSVAIWIVEDYWTFALVILLITLLAVYVTAQESLSNLDNLRRLASTHGDVQQIKPRNESEMEAGLRIELVDDSVLVPGDKILISEHMVIPCDAILISGKVVVDESMLTGESVPVGKVSIDLDGLAGDDNYILTHGTLLENFPYYQNETVVSISNKNKSNLGQSGDLVKDYEMASKRGGSSLFAGTKVKATFGDECVAVVYRTGYRSAKGSLILSLLKPKNDFISFISDAMWVLLVMVVLSTVLYMFSAMILAHKEDANAETIIFWYLDALTCAVPSALIASLSIATTVSIARLKQQHIYVSDTTRVNYAGVVNAVCFDKTGTLTDESLCFQGLLMTRVTEQGIVFDEYSEHGGHHGALPEICQEIMATCHNLLLYGLQDGQSSSAVGDPLELELLRASGWKLQISSVVLGRMLAFPPGSVQSESTAFTILKHFEFSPDRLRAASLVQRPTGELEYFLKGSPEMIIQLCDRNSVPATLQEDLMSLARKGLRVLALAMREFPDSVSVNDVMQMTQSECEETDIRFVGLVFLSNQLKDATQKTIAALHSAKIHTAMITGDHIFTAIAVAEECGILTPTASPQISSIAAAAETLTFKAPSEQLFVIDFDQALHRLIVVDAMTEKIVEGMSLPQLIYLAAQTYLEEIHHDMKNSIQSPLLHASTSSVLARVQLTVTGRGLMAVYVSMPEIFPSLIRYAKVFARTKPNEKKLIVETLMKCPEFDSLASMSAQAATVSSAIASIQMVDDHQDETASLLYNGSAPTDSSASISLVPSGLSKWTSEQEELLSNPMDVAFCGDGANDMIALRAATVGVSLCDSQTSVAAPITSQYATPYAVVDVMREGRCSLITAYVLILFNIMYATIQLFFVNSGYFFGMQASAWSFLIQDLFFGLVLGIVTSYTEPTRILRMTMPPKRFLKFYLLFRLFANLFLFIGFQSLALYIVVQQSFYTEVESDDPFGESYGYPTAVAQHMALGQIMMASVVASIGYPFRRAWHHNIYHVGSLIVQFGWLLFQIFAQDNWFLKNVLDLKPVPVYFGFVVLFLLTINLLACLGITELGDFYFLQSTNQRWFEIVKTSDIFPPDLDRQRKK